MLKKVIRFVLNGMGYDIVRKRNSPSQTLLGLARMPIKTIIDVGANEGQFAKTMASRFPTAQLYCFEPLPTPFAKLKVWADSEPSGRVHVSNVAIGDSVGVLDMYHHTEHNASSSLLRTTDISETLYPFTKEQKLAQVRLTTLDEVLATAVDSLPSEILIKLDVQGYEDRVIRGGSRSFGRAKAVILEVNLDSLYQQQACFKNIVLMLDDLGYDYAGNLDQVYGDDGHVIYIDAVFMRRENTSRC